eukprot:1539956-Prorocentrum_lima.AAC.1
MCDVAHGATPPALQVSELAVHVRKSHRNKMLGADMAGQLVLRVHGHDGSGVGVGDGSAEGGRPHSND